MRARKCRSSVATILVRIPRIPAGPFYSLDPPKAHGSSASGVVALQAAQDRVSAITSVELVREGGQTRLYNSLRLRRYSTIGEVAALVDALAPHGLHIEVWMPKAGWKGRTFDLRVMAISGEIRHLVMRTSQGPITNLHLGNVRGDVEALLRHIPATSLQAAWDTCRHVAAIFSRSLYLGIDLMFTPQFRRHAVLEVNAFGDLLPGVQHRGQDTYTAELAACPNRVSPSIDGLASQSSYSPSARR